MEEIRIEEINLTEPAVSVNMRERESLKKSVSDFGILTPPVIFRWKGKMETIDGWARLLCARELSIEKVECRIVECSIKDALLLHISINKERGFSWGEKLKMFQKLISQGFSENEVCEVWNKITGEKISEEFLRDCLKVYTEIPGIAELLHRGVVNISVAKEVLHLPPSSRYSVLSFITRMKPSTGDSLKLVRLLEEGICSGKIQDAEWLDEMKDIREAIERAFSLSHPYTTRCLKEIESIASALPSGFEIKVPEYLEGNIVEIRMKWDLLKNFPIPYNLNDVFSRIKNLVLKGVEI